MWKLPCRIIIVSIALLSVAFAGGETEGTTGTTEPSADRAPQAMQAGAEAGPVNVLPDDIMEILRKGVRLSMSQDNTGATTFVLAPAPERVIVPLVTDMAQSSALRTLQDAGFSDVKTSYVYAPNIPVGDVISQTPFSPTAAEPGAPVNLVVSQTEIAIQPYVETDDLDPTKQRVLGQLIVHRPFDVELRTSIQNVPIFAISRDERGRTSREIDSADLGFAEARAKGIAERLSVAWTLLDDSAYLDVTTDKWIRPDDVSTWRLREPFAPQYAGTETPCPAIYLHHDSFGANALRIMTIYPEDAASFGPPRDGQGMFTQEELAEYFVALIKAHHLLFHKKSVDLAEYAKLEICQTREGSIFKEICIRAKEAARGQSTEDVRDALARMALSQRERLNTLAHKAPDDWRVRNQ